MSKLAIFTASKGLYDIRIKGNEEDIKHFKMIGEPERLLSVLTFATYKISKALNISDEELIKAYKEARDNFEKER